MDDVSAFGSKEAEAANTTPWTVKHIEQSKPFIARGSSPNQRFIEGKVCQLTIFQHSRELARRVTESGGGSMMKGPLSKLEGGIELLRVVTMNNLGSLKGLIACVAIGGAFYINSYMNEMFSNQTEPFLTCNEKPPFDSLGVKLVQPI